jgi:bifunctional oligoribonuclease and PAP phosphatase NrnA
MISEEQYKVAEKALKESQKILLVSHRKPDGDTLGANIAMHLALRTLNKDTTLACIDLPASRFNFLPEIEKFRTNFNYNDYDLIVICDAGDSKMTGFHERKPEFLSNKVPILNIDHHISNNNFGKWNIVDTDAASATMIVFELLKVMKLLITKNIAHALLAGIYNDTGGLMHSNTTLRVFQTAAELTKAGANAAEISKCMLKEKSLRQLRLWGLIFDRFKVNEQKIGSAVLTYADIRNADARPEDTGGIIDLLATVRDTKFTALVAEDGKGFVKGSFRTNRDDVDVAEIASQFGGGGHKKAAGFRVPARLESELTWKVVPSDDEMPSMKIGG